MFGNGILLAFLYGIKKEILGYGVNNRKQDCNC